MKPVVMLINDLHINKDNIVEFQRNWDEALFVCKSNNIHKILVGGDVFDVRSVQTLAPMIAVRDCFKQATDVDIELEVVNGNHDKVSYKDSQGWCDIYNSMDGVSVFSDYHLTNIGDYYIAMFPYFSEDGVMPSKLRMFDDYLAELDINYSQVILYLHAGVHGALGDFDIPNELPQTLLTKYNKVLCGHYHNRTVIAGTNIEYIGSARQHNFGEDEDKGYTLVYDDGSTTFIKNEVNTRYVTEDISLSEAQNWKRKYDERYKIRLRIHCTSSEAETIDKNDLMGRGGNKVEFETEKIQAIEASQSDFEEKFDTQDLQQEYMYYCGEKGIDSKLGINYLNTI